MKVVATHGDHQVALVDRPDPVAMGDFAVVKLHAVPMCTEYKQFKSGYIGENFGHEAAGEVVEVAQPGRVKVGDRVVVMPQAACGRCTLCLSGEYIHCLSLIDIHQTTGNAGGTTTYAQYLVQQDWQLVPIPDGMSYGHASMAGCGLGPTFNAMELMDVGAFDTVLVTGLGPVGLGGVINAVYRGARVIAAELHPYRAQLAMALGAEAVINPSDPDALEQIRDLTHGLGVDKAVDCSGAAPAQRLMIDAVRRKGQAAFVGQAGDLTIGVSRDMIGKGLTLRGVWHYNLKDTPRLMGMITQSAVSLDRFITHQFPLHRVQGAWELQATGACGKVMLEPWG